MKQSEMLGSVAVPKYLHLFFCDFIQKMLNSIEITLILISLVSVKTEHIDVIINEVVM